MPTASCFPKMKAFRNGKIKINVPPGAEDKASVMVTYTVIEAEGENKVLYTTSTYNVLHVKDMTDD